MRTSYLQNLKNHVLCSLQAQDGQWGESGQPGVRLETARLCAYTLAWQSFSFSSGLSKLLISYHLEVAEFPHVNMHVIHATRRKTFHRLE